jgi:3-hydroxyacyl-CoA dehydrogenase
LETGDIRAVACVGAGTIGSSWATLIAHKGYRVTLYDVTEERVQKGLVALKANLAGMVANDILDAAGAEAALGRVHPTTSLAEAVRDADFVQESGPERYAIKLEIFAELDRLTRPATILSSSSSFLQISEIQKATRVPGRCVISHPYNPPHIIPLVEIVAGAQTAPETVERDRQFMLALGKVPVVAQREVYGFIANRLQSAIINEAVWLVGNGVASATDVDLALRAGPGLRWALMGPFLTGMLASPGGLREVYLGSKFSDPKTTEALAKDGVEAEPTPEVVQWRTQCVEEMEAALAGKDYETLHEWRDNKLYAMLKALGYMEP